MIVEDWLALLAVFICLLLSFFLTGSGTALMASSRARMARLESQGNEQAAIVNRLMATRDRLTGALLICSHVVNVTAAVRAASILLVWFGDIGVIYAIVFTTILVAVFGEVLPRTVAINAPDRVSLLVARPVNVLVRLLGPAVHAVEATVRALLRAAGSRIGEDQPISSAHEELRGTVDQMHREGGVEKQDRDMFGGVLDLRELEVSDVMLHRTNMVTLNADDPPDVILHSVLAAPVTRLPMWRDSPENIVGVLHDKDLLRALEAQNCDVSKIDVMAIASPPWFVPDTTPLVEQLKAFRRRKTPLAMVVDEYGQMMGLVTLEDILEEIVGDITDEHDVVVAGVRPQPSGAVNVEGSVSIRDLNRVMDWNLPDEEATTIAGLVIHESRSIPEAGQTFTFHGFRFQVLRRNRNRITTLRITPLNQKAAAGPPELERIP